MIEFKPNWRQTITAEERQEIVDIIYTMKAVWQEVEHEDVPASRIATLADMAWAVWKERHNTMTTQEVTEP